MPKGQHPNTRANLRANPQNLGVERLPEGVRRTKAFRFALPEALADRLEAMTKDDRNALMARALAAEKSA